MSTGLPDPPAPAEVQRRPLSKRVRFEVFKRDNFTCQYCGAHPPAAILHVDHISPVSKGGSNKIDNLVTACSGCNLGKSNVLLSSVPRSLGSKAAEMVEREEQLRGYHDVIERRRQRIEDDAHRVDETYQKFNPGYYLTERSMVTVRMFVEKLGVHFVIEAMERAMTRDYVREGEEFRYFCGICWKEIKEGE